MKRFVYALIIFFILGILFIFFQNTNRNNKPVTASKPSVKVFYLSVKNNKHVLGPSVLRVNQEDKVTIQITVDSDGELHLHGYDKHVAYKKGQSAQLSFTANLSGRFSYELEDTKTEIGILEVQPK